MTPTLTRDYWDFDGTPEEWADTLNAADPAVIAAQQAQRERLAAFWAQHQQQMAEVDARAARTETVLP